MAPRSSPFTLVLTERSWPSRRDSRGQRLFFKFFWALAKRLYGVAGILFFLILLRAAIRSAPGEEGRILDLMIWLAISLFMGVQGNDMRRKWLESHGYRLAGVISASSDSLAVWFYCQSVANGTAASSSVNGPKAQDSTNLEGR